MDDHYERNGLNVRVILDETPYSPREWNNLGTMVCNHRKYKLGDEQFDADDYKDWDDVKKHLIEDKAAVVILPLSLYDHSQLSMFIAGDGQYRQHESWDSSRVGFIYTTKEMIKSYFGEFNENTTELAEESLRDEVEIYSKYLSSDVYGYVITNPKNNETIESCWNLFGYDEAVEEANSAADNFKHPNEATYAKKASELHG